MDDDVKQAILDLREYANRLAPGDGEEIRRLCKVLTDALKKGECRYEKAKPFYSECNKVKANT
jgi:uncharacterized protein YlaN (UPF0358 family)